MAPYGTDLWLDPGGGGYLEKRSCPVSKVPDCYTTDGVSIWQQTGYPVAVILGKRCCCFRYCPISYGRALICLGPVVWLVSLSTCTSLLNTARKQIGRASCR